MIHNVSVYTCKYKITMSLIIVHYHIHWSMIDIMSYHSRYKICSNTVMLYDHTCKIRYTLRNKKYKVNYIESEL